MTVAPFLRAVPTLAEVAPELPDRLADGARAVSIPAGGWLLHEGESATAQADMVST